MKQLIALDGAGVQFGDHPALQAVSLSIAQGERIALVGPNGSGKSTLLRMLHGCLPVSSGVRWHDPAIRQAMVFQRPFMLRASVLNNVVLGLWLQGRPWRGARTLALRALERVALADQAERPARSLSVGQQQRLALARAWALEPELLFLDEPTANLDPHAKREVEALVDSLGRSGMTMVFASHNLGQVKRLATRVIYLEHGKVLADLPVEHFFDRGQVAHLAPRAGLFLQGEVS